MILDSVRKFCRTELINYSGIVGNKDSTRHLYKKFGDLGLLGPMIKEYDCLGQSYTLYGLVAKEIEYIDSGFRSMFSVQSSLVMNPINNYGSDLRFSALIASPRDTAFASSSLALVDLRGGSPRPQPTFFGSYG